MSLRHVAIVVAVLLVTVPAAPVLAQACTAEQGQLLIAQGRYQQAIKEFTCVIEAQPTEVEGYRGRIEAQLLLGRYSDALGDYARVTALVVPMHPDAAATIFASYDARLALEPQSIPALIGKSFALWWDFQYPQAIHMLNQLLAVRPNDVFGNLFRGSSRLLRNANISQGGPADLEKALALAPNSPDVHFIVADAYTYGRPDPPRAFVEATAAFNGGLQTPRVHAILGACYMAFGDVAAALAHIKAHFDLVTTELVAAPPIFASDSLTLALVPGRTYEVPVHAIAGETIAITTGSKDYWDTIAVVLAPDGTPVAGGDDAKTYFAEFTWSATATATYRLRVTFFEAINSGALVVTRN